LLIKTHFNAKIAKDAKEDKNAGPEDLQYERIRGKSAVDGVSFAHFEPFAFNLLGFHFDGR